MVTWTATGQQVRRVQRKRTKGYRKPADAIYVGRPSAWANMYVIGIHGDLHRAISPAHGADAPG